MKPKNVLHISLKRFSQFLVRCLVVGTISFCCLFFPLSVLPSDGSESLGTLEIDYPANVEKNQPFYLQIWLNPKDRNFNGIVKVIMDYTPRVKYMPQEFTLKAGERKTVRATIVKSDSGLAVIWASAINWDPINVTVDAGFSAKLKTNLSEPIESNKPKTFIINLTDDKGGAVRLDATVNLILEASRIEMFDKQGNKWSERVELQLDKGVSSTPPMEIRSKSWGPDRGVISAKVMSFSGPVANEIISISILPRWYLPMLMAMVGGLLHSMYQVLTRFPGSSGPFRGFLLTVAFPGLISGVLAGLLAYLLARWDVLGIKVDTTSLQGFVILGFLFSYVGIDVVLKKITERKGG